MLDQLQAEWKEHRRTCERCSGGRPGCIEGRDIFDDLREEQRPAPLPWPAATGGSRMDTAFIWGFWFTIGMAAASVVIGLVVAALWALFLHSLFG